MMLLVPGPWRPLLGVIVAAALATGCETEREQPRLTLATTTSVGNSGLLDALLPEFERESGIQVRPLLVGSGRALQMLISGDADVGITHAPDAEATTVEGRSGWFYRKIMFNEFVIVGPRGDPAKVAGAADAVDAMRRIAQSGATFVSRGDSSGTHERERQLWALAGAQPPSGRLVVAGSGMGTTLRVTDNVEAYTLTDEATFEQNAPQLGIVVLFEGDPLLLNTYAIIAPSGQVSAREHARQLAEWLADGAGRRAIDEFRVGPNKVRAFSAWPSGAPRKRPQDLPR